MLGKIQIGEEGNHSGPGGDGGHPAIRRAIVAGVLAARDEVDRLGIDVRIGCNSTPNFDPSQEFWADLGRLGGSEFAGALDYAGLDFFPDVFRPIPPDALVDAVGGVLHGFRDGAASPPPASRDNADPRHRERLADRRGALAERQAEVLETVVRAVAADASNVAAYEHFALRDADSDRADADVRLRPVALRLHAQAGLRHLSQADRGTQLIACSLAFHRAPARPWSLALRATRRGFRSV